MPTESPTSNGHATPRCTNLAVSPVTSRHPHRLGVFVDGEWLDVDPDKDGSVKRGTGYGSFPLPLTNGHQPARVDNGSRRWLRVTVIAVCLLGALSWLLGTGSRTPVPQPEQRVEVQSATATQNLEEIPLGPPLYHGSPSHPREPGPRRNGHSNPLAPNARYSSSGDPLDSDRDDATWTSQYPPAELARSRNASNTFNPLPDPGPDHDGLRFIRTMAQHAWRSYYTHARGCDELRPISKGCKNWHGTSLMLTPLDSLGTLWVMGLDEEYREARELVEKLSFQVDDQVSFFETTIRCLGGLLSAFDLTGDSMFLHKAVDLAERLDKAFDPFTGLPAAKVNLGSKRLPDDHMELDPDADEGPGERDYVEWSEEEEVRSDEEQGSEDTPREVSSGHPSQEEGSEDPRHQEEEAVEESPVDFREDGSDSDRDPDLGHSEDGDGDRDSGGPEHVSSGEDEDESEAEDEGIPDLDLPPPAAAIEDGSLNAEIPLFRRKRSVSPNAPLFDNWEGWLIYREQAYREGGTIESDETDARLVARYLALYGAADFTDEDCLQLAKGGGLARRSPPPVLLTGSFGRMAPWNQPSFVEETEGRRGFPPGGHVSTQPAGSKSAPLYSNDAKWRGGPPQQPNKRPRPQPPRSRQIPTHTFRDPRHAEYDRPSNRGSARPGERLSLAEVGTWQLEYAYLADVTGDEHWLERVDRANGWLWRMSRVRTNAEVYEVERTWNEALVGESGDEVWEDPGAEDADRSTKSRRDRLRDSPDSPHPSSPHNPGLWPQYLSNGEHSLSPSHYAIGGLVDSFYEYLLKQWVYFGKDAEPRAGFLHVMYEEVVDAILSNLAVSEVPRPRWEQGTPPRMVDGFPAQPQGRLGWIWRKRKTEEQRNVEEEEQRRFNEEKRKYEEDLRRWDEEETKRKEAEQRAMEQSMDVSEGKNAEIEAPVERKEVAGDGTPEDGPEVTPQIARAVAEVPDMALTGGEADDAPVDSEERSVDDSEDGQQVGAPETHTSSKTLPSTFTQARATTTALSPTGDPDLADRVFVRRKRDDIPQPHNPPTHPSYQEATVPERPRPQAPRCPPCSDQQRAPELVGHGNVERVRSPLLPLQGEPAAKAVHSYIAAVEPDGRLDLTVEHLACFVGGMFGLGVVSGSSNGTEDKLARVSAWAQAVSATCAQSYHDSPLGLGPERFHPSRTPITAALSAQYYLRPEVIESVFYMWRFTHDPKWRRHGWMIAQAIERWCRVENGYSGIENVNVDLESGEAVRWTDTMESFFMAETLKYMYLLFAGDEVLPLDRYVFNTEAHPLTIRPLLGERLKLRRRAPSVYPDRLFREPPLWPLPQVPGAGGGEDDEFPDGRVIFLLIY